VASFENLHTAFVKASHGKRNRLDVARFGMQWEKNIVELSEQILGGAYTPGPYRIFTVHEKKTRIIMAAPFIDRIVHHAVCNVVTPLLERAMTPNSCANRIGMGTRKGLSLFGRFAHQYPYVLKCDIRQFFPSIDRDILLELLRPEVRDERLRALVRQILSVAPCSCHSLNYFHNEMINPCEHVCGLPIGNMTSQTWANWYLNGLDHFIMDYRGYGAYVRYVDDFAIFGESKSALQLLKEQITEYLQRLRLSIHPEKSRVYKTSDGVPFLGFRHFRTHRVLNKSNIRRFRRRVRGMVKAEAPMEKLRASIAGWSGFARLGDTAGLRSRLAARFHRLASGQGVEIPRSAWGLVEQR
jgi:RNA-directed DNA polymerase